MPKRDLIRGTSLVSLGEILNKFIGVGGFAALAIWLSPADYGQFAIAWMFYAIADVFLDFGTSISYHQHAKNSTKALGLYRSLLIILGIFWTSIMCIACAFLWISSKEDISITLFVLSTSLIFRSLSVPYFSYWVRNNTYLYLVMNKIISAIIGVVASVYMAYQGFGEISLAIRFPISAFCGFILVLFVSNFVDKLYLDINLYKDWLLRGIKYTATVNWGWMLFFYVEQQIILLFYGESALGLYNYAKKILDVGMQVVNTVSKSIVQPYFIQHSFKLVKVFKFSVGLISLGVLLSVILSLLTPAVSNYVDSEWLNSLDYFNYLIFIMPIGLGSSVFVAYLVSIDNYLSIFKAELLGSSSLILLGGLTGYYQLGIKAFILTLIFSYAVKLIYFWIKGLQIMKLKHGTTDN